MIIELKYLLINSDKDKKEANWEHLNLESAIEVETKTTTKRGLVTGIAILLDMISIALRDNRSNV